MHFFFYFWSFSELFYGFFLLFIIYFSMKIWYFFNHFKIFQIFSLIYFFILTELFCFFQIYSLLVHFYNFSCFLKLSIKNLIILDQNFHQFLFNPFPNINLNLNNSQKKFSINNDSTINSKISRVRLQQLVLLLWVNPEAIVISSLKLKFLKNQRRSFATHKSYAVPFNESTARHTTNNNHTSIQIHIIFRRRSCLGKPERMDVKRKKKQRRAEKPAKACFFLYFIFHFMQKRVEFHRWISKIKIKNK